MIVKTRFAPSPTGYLHLGNARTALLCYLLAKKEGGEFILRIDDTDLMRSEEQYVDAIQEDLRWLGLDWRTMVRQSAHVEKYHAAVKKLEAMGRIYPCFESAEELDIKRKMQATRGLPPVYDRTSLKLTAEQKQQLLASGKKPHYRFLLEHKKVTFTDAIKGDVTFDLSSVSDPIVLRENGAFTYMLPSVIDDIELNITHVIRGEDHLTNTAVQTQMFEALGSTFPIFAHNALIHSDEGKLSKRLGSGSVRALREQGIEAMAINSFLARLGTSLPIEVKKNLSELSADFALATFGTSPTHYALDDILRLNQKLVHQLDFAEAKARLNTNITEGFWLAVRPNLSLVKEAEDWWKLCHEPLTPVIEDGELTEMAATLLPQIIDAATWEPWIKAVQEKSGKKGKALFMPIRKALTGEEHGPELKNLLPLLGREKIIARLSGKAA